MMFLECSKLTVFSVEHKRRAEFGFALFRYSHFKHRRVWPQFDYRRAVLTFPPLHSIIQKMTKTKKVIKIADFLRLSVFIVGLHFIRPFWLAQKNLVIKKLCLWNKFRCLRSYITKLSLTKRIISTLKKNILDFFFFANFLWKSPPSAWWRHKCWKESWWRLFFPLLRNCSFMTSRVFKF